jgi:hypothetical protein
VYEVCGHTPFSVRIKNKFKHEHIRSVINFQLDANRPCVRDDSFYLLTLFTRLAQDLTLNHAEICIYVYIKLASIEEKQVLLRVM